VHFIKTLCVTKNNMMLLPNSPKNEIDFIFGIAAAGHHDGHHDRLEKQTMDAGTSVIGPG